MAPNFNNLLNKPLSDVKRPVAIPDGSYFAVIKNHEFGESSQKKTPYVQFNCEVQNPHEDTDLEGMPEGDILGKKLRLTYYITDESLYRLVDFLNSCGVATEGRGLGEVIPQVTGQTILLDVVRKPNQAGDGMFNEVRNGKGLNPIEGAEEAGEAPQTEGEAPARRRRA